VRVSEDAREAGFSANESLRGGAYKGGIQSTLRNAPMRQWYLPLVLLSVAACSRAPAPAAHLAGSAPPPPPDAAAAQAQPSPAASVRTGQSAKVSGPASAPAAALNAPRQDPRWRDVDPAELADAKPADPALAKFQDEQHRRDQQLMAQDAEEAARQADRGDGRVAREDERYDEGTDRDAYRGDGRYAGDERERSDDRYGGDPRYAARRESRARERAQAYGDGRDEGYYRDDPYARQDDYPPPPEDDGYYGDEPEEMGPPPDEDYDPRDYDPYRR